MIKTVKFKNGERYPFLVDENGAPDFWVTHFVTQNLRMSHTRNGIENYLRSIIHLKSWEQINNRNLLDDIYNGKVPSTNDILSIKEHCSLHAKSLKVQTNRKIVNMNKFYMTKANKPTVSNIQQGNRMAHIAEFIYFIGIERVKHKATASELFDKLHEMHQSFKNNKLRGGSHSPTDKSGIPVNAFEDFVKVARIDSKDNPFKDDLVKLRNYLIIQTLYETGIRASELLALQINDIGTDIRVPTISITRRHDNKDDPRLREPTAKTLGREIPISSELRDLINMYVYDIRSKEKTSKRHPFIFVSHKVKAGSYESGQPITYQLIVEVIKSIKSVNPEYFFGITAHQFRHYFNERLSDVIDERKREIDAQIERFEEEGKHETAKRYRNEHEITEKRELEIRAQLNGHSSLESGRTYLKRTVKKQASVVRNKMQENLKNKVMGILDG